MVGIGNIGNTPVEFGLGWAALGGALPRVMECSNVFMGLGVLSKSGSPCSENFSCCKWRTAGFVGVLGRPVLIIPGEMLPGPDMYLGLILPSLYPSDLLHGTESLPGISVDLSP